jgi:hypothetical protein
LDVVEALLDSGAHPDVRVTLVWLHVVACSPKVDTPFGWACNRSPLGCIDCSPTAFSVQFIARTHPLPRASSLIAAI